MNTLEKMKEKMKEKNEKITKPKRKITKVKKQIIVTAFVLVSVIGGLAIADGTNNAKEALKIQNVDSSLETIQAIEDKFGRDIHGFWVWTLCMTSGEYPKYIDGKCITLDGRDVQNRMRGADVVIKYADGSTTIIPNYKEDTKVYPEEKRLVLPSISYEDLIKNYVLSLEKNEPDEKGNDNGYSYKLVPKNR